MRNLEQKTMMTKIMRNNKKLVMFITCIIYCSNNYLHSMGITNYHDKKECYAIENLDSFISNPNIFFTSAFYLNDSCAISLIDTIHTLYLEGEDTLYLDVLSKICSKSDGYLIDHINDVLSSLLIDNFDDIVLYMYNNRNSCFSQQFQPTFEYLYLLINGNMPTTFELVKFLRLKSKENNLSNVVTNYLESLLPH